MKPTVFVIESSHDIRVYLRSELEGKGYLVISAADGRSALEALQTMHAPAVILLDFDLPVVTGEDILAELKRRDLTRPVPVIQIASPGAARHPLAAALVEKPIRLDTLLAAIEAARKT